MHNTSGMVIQCLFCLFPPFSPVKVRMSTNRSPQKNNMKNACLIHSCFDVLSCFLFSDAPVGTAPVARRGSRSADFLVLQDGQGGVQRYPPKRSQCHRISHSTSPVVRTLEKFLSVILQESYHNFGRSKTPNIFPHLPENLQSVDLVTSGV